MSLLEGALSPGTLARLPGLRQEFLAAKPFPHVVLDNFLTPDLAEGLLGEFPAPSAMPKSRDYLFGDKHELSSVASQGAASRALHDVVLSPEFADVLSTMTGRELFVDPAFHGGGFHQGRDGSFLDMHVDFNVHPEHADWLRVLNILLYLNRDWKPDWNGRLMIKSKASGQSAEIEPLFNRAVLMLTSDDTLHGYARMSLPDGVTRKSVATYAYSPITVGSVVARTTGWEPEGAGPLKTFLARHYNTAVLTKNRWFGSRTSGNR